MEVNDFLKDQSLTNAVDSTENKHELQVGTYKKYISHSQAVLYSTCALQYYFRYIEKIPSKQFSGPVFGTTVHKVMELFFKAKLHDKQTLRSDILKDSFKDLWSKAGKAPDLMYSKSDVDFDTLAAKGPILMEAAVEKFKLLDPICVEQDFLIPIIDPFTNQEVSPIYLKGQIDLIAKDPLGDGVNIYDHKCVAKTYSQSDVDRNDQLTTYAYAYRQLHKQNETACVFNCFVKTKVPKIEVLSTVRSKADVNWMIKYYKYVIDGIQNKVWTPRKSEKCAGCSYFLLCKEWGNKQDIVPVAAPMPEPITEESSDD